MLTVEYLLDNKENLNELVSEIREEDIKLLYSLLDEKKDEIRYTAFLALQKRSLLSDDVFSYWDLFCNKMESENSYQRSIGIMLIAENIRWDKENKTEDVIERYLLHCSDEKFITSRQTIQSIKIWLSFKPQLFNRIINTLINIDIKKFKETQQKLILLDIIGVLLKIEKIAPDDKVKDYIVKAMTGNILDKKSVKEIQKVICF
ncbi:MAG: hypothetical protein N2Z65_00620 [Clostridiales bacterium]|nr:hypothetical protein [Clostridiales bacterium]